jgi:hypothetical protein
MPYSDADMAEIPHDRARLRAWCWRAGMRSKRLAAEYRQQSRAGWDDGFDRLRWAGVLERLA